MAAGKVCTGFSKPYVANYSANGGNITLSNGRVLARGVSVNVAPDSAGDNDFYADNQKAESSSGIFTGGTLTLTVDGLLTEAERFIMGLPSAEADGFTAYGDNQEVPYIAVGFLTKYMSSGVTTYVPTIIVKTKFNQLSLDAETQGEEIDWQTQELTSSIMRGDDSNHTWKYLGQDYTTEEAAEEALRTKLGIVTPVTAYTVTQNLTNVTSSFTGESINSGEAFSATLTAESTYTLGTVTVEMGGVDISSTAYDSLTNKVLIASVSGNIEITAEAAQ